VARLLDTIRIPARYNGPPGSGNGGYCCGMLASCIDGPARVRLHAPPPLETPLEVHTGRDSAVELYAGDILVGSAWPEQAWREGEIPPAPSLQAARKASRRFPGHKHHDYPTCFVCGTRRRADGLCIFPGPVADWSLLACNWLPPADMLDAAGMVRREIVWAALDCPGYFAAVGQQRPLALLGELVTEIRHPVPGGQPLVVYCWPLGREGRKSRGAAALADASGRLLATSRSIWISLKNAPAPAQRGGRESNH